MIIAASASVTLAGAQLISPLVFHGVPETKCPLKSSRMTPGFDEGVVPPEPGGFFGGLPLEIIVFSGARFDRLNSLIPKSQDCFSPSCMEGACLSIVLEQATRVTNPSRTRYFTCFLLELKNRDGNNNASCRINLVEFS